MIFTNRMFLWKYQSSNTPNNKINPPEQAKGSAVVILVNDVQFLFNNSLQKVRIFPTWGSVENVRDKKVGLNV